MSPTMQATARAIGPPWIVFRHGDGTADILPAMRPGHVVEGVPLEFAHRRTAAANRAHMMRMGLALSRLARAMRDLMDAAGMEEAP